jgi:hypothetical protein
MACLSLLHRTQRSMLLPQEKEEEGVSDNDDSETRVSREQVAGRALSIRLHESLQRMLLLRECSLEL